MLLLLKTLPEWSVKCARRVPEFVSLISSFAGASLSFGVGSGVLIAVPFQFSAGDDIELAIQQALTDAQ